MKLIKSGKQVGSVSFDPYEFDYSGDDDLLQKTLQGATEYSKPNTGPTPLDNPLTPGERWLPLQPDRRRELLENRLSYIGINLVEDN